MTDRDVILAKQTRREFREAIAEGKFRTAIVPVGSHEQHLEHLAMEHDTASVNYVAVGAAKLRYPHVTVTMPMSIGISEHHMSHKGTVSAKPGAWLSILFDTVESLVRHGITRVLILNGHGGNTAPVNAIIQQWRLYFKMTAPDVDLHFVSYWDLIPKDFADQHLNTKRMPGHAQEFETAFALALFPENVRHEAMQDQPDKQPLEATAEAGWALANEAVRRVAEYLEGMIQGAHRAPEVKHFP